MENTPTKWYALRVVSGKEKKIKEILETHIHNEWNKEEWGSDIQTILLPTEKVIKVQAGKKVTRERNRFPGYLIIEIVQHSKNKGSTLGMHDDLRDAVNNLPNVIHFLGKENPVPLRDDEMIKMLGKIDELAENASILEEVPETGESIKIIEGFFNGFNGIVQEVNKEKKRVKVIVKILGRETPAELSFMQIERLT